MATRKRAAHRAAPKAKLMMFNGKMYKVTPLSAAQAKSARSEMQGGWLTLPSESFNKYPKQEKE